MKIDWVTKLQHLLQVLAFCLAVATIQYGFQPQQPYVPSVVHSLFIGTTIWAIIDLGRHLMPSSAETGWPQGWAGIALVVGGIGTGYLVGTTIADRLCEYYGWYAGGGQENSADHWRTSILITVLAGWLVIAPFGSCLRWSPG